MNKIPHHLIAYCAILFVSMLWQTQAHAETFAVSVSHSKDDAEEASNGTMSRKSSDLELTRESSTQKVGLRFKNINIPKDVTITNAYIKFHVDETDSGDTFLTIKGEARDNASRFGSSKYNISQRSTTSSSINWSPAPWTHTGDPKNTPDLKNIVQEIIDRNGWETGNSMAFIITGTGKRVADSYNGSSSKAPRLYIEYTTAENNNNNNPDPNTLTLAGTLRDFNASHPDFQSSITGLALDMVKTQLGDNRKPIFNKKNSSTSNASNFNQWFTDVTGVNQSLPYNITLEKQDGLYVYDSAVNPVGNDNNPKGFFPLDDKLLGNEGRVHNYHMTYEIHSQFTYQGGETFKFSGDDDVWVFINNQLVVDIGGIHGAIAKQVSLDNLNLTVGETYNFDMFWAERHTTQSNFKITTSIKLEDTTNPPPDGDSQCTAIFEDDFESALSDKWRTLKASGGFTPQIVNVNGNGRLRLTDRAHNLSTAVTLDYVFPSKDNTFIMEFDYYAYGGCSDGRNYKNSSSGAGNWGADGIALALFDSAVGRSPRVGATGGSLGYAQKTREEGFEKGWFGLGIDEFGNYKTHDEGRRDIDGHTHNVPGEEPNTIAIRGSAPEYRLLTASTPLAKALAQLNNSSYKSGRYRFTVDMSKDNQQDVTLERNTGSSYETILGPFNALDPSYHQEDTPEKFRFAFTSGTGGACNIHEIDNIKVCGEGEEYTGGTPICWGTTDDNTQIYKIDPKAGANPLPQSIVIEADRVLRAEGGSYRPSDGYLYKFDDDGETYNNHESDDGPDSLYKINLTTGKVTLAAAALVPDHVDAAEFYINPETKEEIFYAIEKGKKLYAFNPVTWQPLAGYPKTLSVSSIGGLAINSLTGEAYVTDDYNWNNQKPKLYKLNLQTGVATLLFTLADTVDAEGLAFADDGNLYVENDSGVGSSSTRNKIHRINLTNGQLEEASHLTGLNGDIETLACNGGASIAPPVDPPETDDPLFDYGDAPESYNHAFHILPANATPTLYLGATPPDSEVLEDVTPYPYPEGAMGDDLSSSNDEDGVTMDGISIQGQNLLREQIYILNIKTQGNGYLNAWVDWNANGLFENNEKISSNEQSASGTIRLSVIIPESATLGTTYARFRYSSNQDLRPAGPADDGEVEDYSIVIADSIPLCSMDEVPSSIYSTAAVAVNLNRLDQSTRVFQTQFNNAKWEGHLLSYDLNTTNNEGSTRAQQWNAANKLPAFNVRKLISYNPEANNSKGINFVWGELNSTQKQALKAGENTNTAKKRLNWVRGEQSHEDNSQGPFRERNNLLGDIIHSSPIFSGQRENYGYTVLAGTEGASYPSFLTAKQSRQAAIFVGANDGILHAFNANTGEELFGFIPNEVIPNLAKLSSTKYGCHNKDDDDDCIPHQYYVDGVPTLGDVYINNQWRTVLIGTLGKGGKGIFALDITNPDPETDPNVSFEKFDTNKIMWELSATQATHNAAVYAEHMGYSTPTPTIVRLNTGQWATVISNGYESNSGKAVLFLIDISTGALIKTIDTGVGSPDIPNGLSSPIVIDTNNDRIADVAYAGDLQGNMWKFNLGSTNSDDWGIAYQDNNTNTPKPLFTACENPNETPCTKPQAISAKPEVGYHPAGGYMVYFGTGQYFDVGDNVVSSSPGIHALYGIRDNGAALSDLTSLVQQTILQETVIPDTGNDLIARITSKNPVDYSNKNGWYMPLVAPNNTQQGERIIAKAILREDRLIVTTLIPPQNSCTWGGSSWITELNALDGTPLDAPPIDVNDDMQFTDADKVEYQGQLHVISAIKKLSLGMVLSTPEIITHTVLSEGKYMNGTVGTIGMFRESASRAIGRQSWRQLR